jgi:hypothetical protein
MTVDHIKETSTMTKTLVLTTEQMEAQYPGQWLLVTEYELDASTSLRKGRVVAHSKDRDEIHRALKQHTGNLCIHFTGRVPQDTVVVFPCRE